MEQIDPEYQLNQIAATAGRDWSTTKEKRVTSSSKQLISSSTPQHEMSQLEHMDNPVTEQYIRGQDGGGNEFWRQIEGHEAKALLPNNEETVKFADDTSSTQTAVVLGDLFDELSDASDQPSADDYDNDIVGNSVFPTSPSDPGFVNSTDNTLVLGDSSEMNDESSILKVTKERTVYTPDPFPSNASFRQICTMEIHHSEIKAFCACVAFHFHQIPGLKSGKYRPCTRMYECHCGSYRLKTFLVDKHVPVQDRKFMIDPTYLAPVIISTKELQKPYHMRTPNCTCDTASIPLKPAILASMPMFQSWMQKSLHPLSKHYSFGNIKERLQESRYNITFSDATFTDVKYSVMNYLCKIISEEYKYLPALVKALYDFNQKTVSVALQADSEHRFCRWFHGFPIAKYHGVLTQPPYIVDCFHPKCKMYGGRIFLFASRTGFGRTVIEAIAYIPDESAGHICWLIQMCWRHGMKLEDAIFTDQGPFLAAMGALNKEFMVSFFTMLCLQHIFRNIHDGFGVLFVDAKEKKRFRSMMNAASFCDDQLSFFQTIFEYLHSKISRCPANHRHLYITLILYMLRLHPGLWTVFANAPKFDHEYYKQYLRNYILPSLFSALFINLNFRSNEHWELKDAGDFLLECRVSAQNNTDDFIKKYENFIRRADGPCPRFHIARTNCAESQGASFLFCGFRYEPPPRAIPIILKQYNHQIDLLVLDLKRNGNSPYTTTGIRLKTAATEQGIVYDSSCTAFSGAVNHYTSDDGSSESSNPKRSSGCGLELLSSDDDGEEEDVGSHEEVCGFIPPQSQSSLARIPDILTFPTSQTTSTEEETVKVYDDNDVQFSFQQTQQSSNLDIDNDNDTNIDIDIGDLDSERSHSGSEIDSEEEYEGVAEGGIDDTSTTHSTIGDFEGSVSSDAEIPDNYMQDAAIEGNFRSRDGRQYNVHLKWKFPKVQNQQFDPSYQHQCNLCVLNASMVQFPCYCILSLATYAANEDRRFPKHHVKGVKHGVLPDEFYPRCFLSKRNLDLVLSDSCVLKLRIPTQDELIRYPVVEPHLKPPPQYRLTLEMGYRYTSRGESGNSRKSTKAHGHETIRKNKSDRFANKFTQSVAMNAPIGDLGVAMKDVGREFAPDPVVCQAILDASVGKKGSGPRLCGRCQQKGHTQNKCLIMYVQGSGVVKPKLIVTGKYVVYLVQDEVSHDRLNGKPVELTALSSKDINSRMFRSYNPDDDPLSNIAVDQKKIVSFLNGRETEEIEKQKNEPKRKALKDMTMIAIKKKFSRQVKDISDETTAFKVPINDKVAMVEWLITNSKVIVEDPNIVDTYHDTDINRANSLEASLLLNKKIACCAYNTPIVTFGSQTSISETEWVMLTVFNAVQNSREALDTLLFNNNAHNPQNPRSETAEKYKTVNRLANRYGTKKIIEYIEQRTLAKYHGDFNSCDASADVTSSTNRDPQNRKVNKRAPVPVVVIDLCGDDEEQSKEILCIFSQVDEDEDDIEVVAEPERQSAAPSGINRLERRKLKFERLLVITERDFRTLNPGKWLNDTVISAFFSVLQLNEKRKEVLFMPTYLIYALLGFDNDTYDYEQVDKYFKRKDILGASVVYVPINIDKNHWILGCIHPLQFRIDIFDSLHNDDTRSEHYGSALLYMMEDRTKSLGLPFDMNKWVIIDKCCPQQINTCDCGISVCLNALFQSRGFALNYNGLFMEERRDEIKNSILSKEIRITTNGLLVVQSSISNHSLRDVPIKDLSNLKITFTIVSRFDGAVPNSRLDVFEEQELDDKVKPDYDDLSTQSTISEEVGPSDRSAKKGSIKQDDLIKRLTMRERGKMKNKRAGAQAEKEPLVARVSTKPPPPPPAAKASTKSKSPPLRVAKAKSSDRTKSKRARTLARLNERSKHISRVSTKPPPPPPPPAAKASTKSKSPPLRVAKAKSSDRTKSKRARTLARLNERSKHVKLLMQDDQSLSRIQVNNILDKFKGVFLAAQRYVQSEKSIRDKKLSSAVDDCDSHCSSDGQLSVVDPGYISEEEWEQYIENGDVLTELSSGDTVIYIDIVECTRCTTRILSIKKAVNGEKLTVALKDGTILQGFQTVWSPDFRFGQKFQELVLNEGGDPTASNATYYINRGKEMEVGFGKLAEEKDAILEQLVGKTDDELKQLLGKTGDEMTDKELTDKELTDKELNAIVPDCSSPRRSRRSPCPNRMYGASSGFVGITKTKARKTKKGKNVRTIDTRPLPTTESPVAVSLSKKRRRSPNPKYSYK